MKEKESVVKNIVGGRFALVAGGQFKNTAGEEINYKPSVQLSGGVWDIKKGVYKIAPSYLLEIVKCCESDKSFRKDLEEQAKIN